MEVMADELKANTLEVTPHHGDDNNGDLESSSTPQVVEEITNKASKRKEKIDKLAKVTIKELDSALKDTHELLTARDEEIIKLKQDLEQYKKQAAKEVASKTKLAQLLDESTRHATELEDSLVNWQLSVKEYQQQVKQLEAALIEERGHTVELEKRFSELYSKKNKETEQLTVQLKEARQLALGKQQKDRSAASLSSSSILSSDDSQMIFLKQAVYHLLIDSRPEEHLRAIASMLNFTAEERKTVYAKFKEKGFANNNART